MVIIMVMVLLPSYGDFNQNQYHYSKHDLVVKVRLNDTVNSKTVVIILQAVFLTTRLQ